MILIDLEKWKPVDLLPDRKSSSLSKWLKDHPGIEMITRDRSTEYARGVTEASQDIQQIIDRWHLLKNLREAVERLLNRFRDRLKKLPAVDPLVANDSTVLAGRLRLPSSTEQALRAAKRQCRYELYLEIHKLHQEHLNIKAIAQKVSVSRTTVYKFLAAPSFPEQATRNLSPRILDP
jgi:transposase